MRIPTQKVPPPPYDPDEGSERPRPSRAEAEAAVRTLIAWAGEDPERKGLRATPGRVVRAYEEFFFGYSEDPGEMLWVRHSRKPKATTSW